MNKVVKGLLACVVIGGVAVAGSTGYKYYVESQSEVLSHLKSYNVVLECGAEEPQNLDYYVEMSDINSRYADTSDFSVSCDGEVDSTTGYINVGSYNITLTCGDEKEVIPLEIQDTTKPTIAYLGNVDSITVVECSDINYKDLISAYDKVGDTQYPISKLEILSNNINLSIPGEYQLVVQGEDSHGNTNTLDLAVNVLSVEEAYSNGYSPEMGISTSEKYEEYKKTQDTAKLRDEESIENKEDIPKEPEE